MLGLSSPVKKLFGKSSGDRRLVLHVGPHKTATTYIQENLNAARSTLAKAGWIYPNDPLDGRAGQHSLAHDVEPYLASEGPQRDVLDAWADAALSRNQSIILSAEGLCRLKPDQLDRLAQTLGFETYEIVYAIRDPLELFPSLWAEEVKHGHTIGFAERFARIFARPLRSRLLNPMLDLTPWLEKDWVHVHAVPFDLLRRNDIDICSHIVTQILQVPKFEPAVTGLVNEKTSLEVTEFLRLITLMHFQGATRNGPDLRTRFMTHMTPDYAAKIENMMLSDAHHARRDIPMRGNLGFRNAIDANLKERLADNWTCDVPPEENLFAKKNRVFSYYSEYVLSITPSVVAAAQDILKKMYD